MDDLCQISDVVMTEKNDSFQKEILLKLEKSFFRKKKTVYLDGTMNYSYILRDYSKISEKNFHDIFELDCKEISSGNQRQIISYQIDKDSGILLFAIADKKPLEESFRKIKRFRKDIEGIFPVEYMIGFFMKEQFSEDNAEIITIVNDIHYYTILRKGQLCWVGKETELYEDINTAFEWFSRKAMIKNDFSVYSQIVISDKTIDFPEKNFINIWDLKKNNCCKIEKIFWWWLEKNI